MTVASGGAPASTTTLRFGSVPSSTWKISWWMWRGSTPRPVSSASAPVTMPNGPQRYHSSTDPTGRSEPKIAESRSVSRRPWKSSTSWASRDSTLTRWKRPGKRFLRSSSSSRNMIELVRRLPKSSVAREPGSSSRALVSSESTGVMPEPAAIAT